MSETDFTKVPETREISCNLCGASEPRMLYEAIDRLHGFNGTFQYVRCSQCGLVYMNPQITFEAVAKYYPQDYAPHRAKIKSPLTKKEKWPVRKKNLDTITVHSRVLDAGCGSGGFLANLNARTRCRIYGFDISEKAIKTASEIKGIDVFRGTISEAPYEEEFFDVITARSYIEHVNDPFGVLQQMHRLLKPGGVLVLKTPNIDSFNASVFKDRWYHLDCPRHLFLFSPKTLTDLLKRAGFSVCAVDFDQSSKSMLASLQYVFYENNYEPRTKNCMRRSKAAKMLVSPLARLLCLMKKSDAITVYAEKKGNK